MMMLSSRRILLTVSGLLFLSLLNGPSWQAAALTNQQDVAALKSLHDHWAGSASVMLNDWVGNDPCGSSWPGVTCDNTDTHVTELALNGFDLVGGIPSTIGSFASLQSLDLSYNPQLGGTLPQELGNLTSLQTLTVKQCGLTGPIPSELGQLTNLTYLAINQNGLTGSIPPAIGKLVNMFWFDISENSLNGSLPISTSNSLGLDNLTGAKHFHFFNNFLSGQIPKEIFSLPLIFHLLLNSNAFEGKIPNETLSNAKGLGILNVANNQLRGPLPPELNKLIGLTELQLSNNIFNQTLPDLSAVTNLELLDVSHNPFDLQEFPNWAYSLTSLQTITMDSTHLTGNLNSSIVSLPALISLSLSNNSLNGTFSLGNPSSTIGLIDLQYNNFSGFTNPNIVDGAHYGLRLAYNPLCLNSFYGSSICQPIAVTKPWAATPNASCHESCSGEQTLNPNLCSCARPVICHMRLTAPAFSLVNDTEIASLSDEWAQGFTSKNLGVRIDQNQVYIRSANFTREGQMLFDLLFFPFSGDSFNSTEIEIIIVTLSGTKISISEGPYGLLGFDLYKFPPGKKSKTGLIIGVVVAAIVAGIIIALVALYAIRQKRRADKSETSRPFASWGSMPNESGDAPQLKGARWFSLAELRKATNDFSEDNELGVGGYGTVYRAVLPDGGVVAVKRAAEGSAQGAVEFKNEIELLSRVHHKNLVGLVGFCYEQGEQALVYEYMPKGTLREHLLGQYDLPLTWEMRVAIALGSARGLAYLHELANPPIIHRDIKSGNILLDEKMVAKVADFGLSRLVQDGTDKANVSSQVKGTMGYLDPEYYMTNNLSEKSDVYSFGVVLLEMLSARPPIERGRYIVREVRTALNKGGMKALELLLDPFLGDYPPKQLEAFLDVALVCVEEVGTGRPTMSEVVKKLEYVNGRSQPSSGVHITIEPQKDEIYGKEHLQKVKDPSFQYSGEPFTANAKVEPK